MDSIAKVKAALSHHQGPIPIDFGAIPTSGMHVSCVAELRKYHGLEEIPVHLSGRRSFCPAQRSHAGKQLFF